MPFPFEIVEAGQVEKVTTKVGEVEVSTELVGGSAVAEIADSTTIDQMISIAASQMSSFDVKDKALEVETVDGEVTISADSLQALKKADASLSVISNDISVSVHPDDLGEDRRVTFSLTESPELNDDQKAAAVGALTVFDVSAGDIHRLEGTATISVDFDLPSGKDPETVRVLYVSENGETEDMNAEYKSGIVTFETTHFSVYMIVADSQSIGPDQPDVPDTPDTPDQPSHPDIPFIPGGGDDGGVVIPPVTIVEETGEGEGGLTTTETAIVATLAVLAAIAASMMVFALRRR